MNSHNKLALLKLNISLLIIYCANPSVPCMTQNNLENLYKIEDDTKSDVTLFLPSLNKITSFRDVKVKRPNSVLLDASNKKNEASKTRPYSLYDEFVNVTKVNEVKNLNISFEEFSNSKDKYEYLQSKFKDFKIINFTGLKTTDFDKKITSETTIAKTNPNIISISIVSKSLLTILTSLKFKQDRDLIKNIRSDALVCDKFQCEVSRSHVGKNFVFLNNGILYNRALIGDDVTISGPFSLESPTFIQSGSIINTKIRRPIELYIETKIKKNTALNCNLVTLEILNENSNGVLCTEIGENNIIGCKYTVMCFIANNVSIGNNNVLKEFYIGPNVKIGNYNKLVSAIIFGNSVIEDNVHIGCNVIIGKNVVIKSGAKIDDCVIIEDDVEIGVNTVIYANVHIKKGAFIDKNVIIHHKVTIGERTIISKCTCISYSVFISKEVTIFSHCNIKENVMIESYSIIGNGCNIFENVVINGTVNSNAKISYYYLDNNKSKGFFKSLPKEHMKSNQK